MTEREYNDLREISWRRPLHPAEEAQVQTYLALHPEALSDWEAESGLTHLLDQTADVPLASNFTAQVLQALDREDAAPARRAILARWWQRWLQNPLPRLAWATAILLATFYGYQQYQHHEQEQLTKGLVQFSRASGLNEPTVFQDFDVIQRLGQVPAPADEELWLVLSKAPARSN